MMLEVGKEFHGQNRTWLQTRIYEFDAMPVKLPDEWNRVILNRAEKEGQQIQEIGSALMWKMNIPMDHAKPYDLRGAILFFNILSVNIRYCGEMVQSKIFKDYLNEKQADVVIIDHFIQECFVAASALLNTTSVMFSNWPVADGYVTAINVPANPAIVPKTGTAFSSIRMSFFDRLRNTIFHWIIAAARQIHAWFINYFYAKWGYPHIDLDQIQSKHLFYAGRSEFLAESIRPLTNRLKHFGCSECKKKTDYQIRRPSSIVSAPKTTSKAYNSWMSPRKLSESSRVPPIVLELHKNLTLNVQMAPKLCLHDCSVQLDHLNNAISENATKIQISNLEALLIGGNLTEMEERYVKTQQAFKSLDLSLLDDSPFVLVSFGSVAQPRFLPDVLLEQFLHTFRKLAPLRFVWQTNSGIRELIGQREVPENLILVPWAPIKILLAHHNLQFAILHGGVNTINEVLNFGVSVLGIPLQNIQRLRELGMADLVSVQELYEPNFFLQKLRQFHNNLPKLRTRARKVSNMISGYRQLNGGNQNFWLHWAQRHGKRLQSSNLAGHKRSFIEQDLITSFDYFCVKEIGLWSMLILFLIILISK